MIIKKCELGCINFTGGEIKHDKNCVFYKDSMSELFDRYRAALKDIKNWNDDLEDAYDCQGTRAAVALGNTTFKDK